MLDSVLDVEGTISGPKFRNPEQAWTQNLEAAGETPPFASMAWMKRYPNFMKPLHPALAPVARFVVGQPGNPLNLNDANR